ncbi:MAG: hypothetical protein DSZ06_04235 [Sulfurospirillum sp.]|nr:MAG: hypothetical protein DSZ06_04235 [Sulfurospirillum sp.]
MRRFLLALLGLILLLGLSFLCFRDKADSIKENLLSKTNAALNSHNITWAKPELIGDDLSLTDKIRLTGEAPSSEAKEEAGRVVSSIDGVWGVQNDLIVANPNMVANIQEKKGDELETKEHVKVADEADSSDEEKKEKSTNGLEHYSMYMVKNADGKLFLEGYVPSQEVHEKLLKDAQKLFGKDKIVDSLKIAKDAPKDWEYMSQFGLKKLSKVDFGDMNITDYGYLFKGHLSTHQKKMDFLNAIKKVMADPQNHYGRYRGDYIVTAPVESEKQNVKVAEQKIDTTSDKEVITQPKIENVTQPKIEDLKANIGNSGDEKKSEILANKPEIKEVPYVDEELEKKSKVIANKPAIKEAPSAEEELETKTQECQNLINSTINSRKIHFAYNSSKIKYDSYPILNDVISTLAKCDLAGHTLEIAGHTDSSGSEKYNKWLSQQRANKVKEYLLRHGVSEYKIESYGYGESMPIASNKTKSGRALNRRIEFNIK